MPTRRPVPAPSAACPCGLPAPYAACCGRFHSGQAAAPTAEALMRSRYAAFAVGDEGYLLRTWHPGTRPGELGLDASTRWTGLEILGTGAGSAFHSAGTVEFRAGYTHRGRAGEMRERSRFTRVDGDWVYVDGDVEE